MRCLKYVSTNVIFNQIGEVMTSFNKTIQMLIFDGNPNGLMMCELSNWNGRVYKISRSELGKFAKRSDAENTGIYFLFGKDEENSETIYIGEAEKILTRLKQHLKDENYWNDCIVVVSKDNLLNKAHAKYLENEFYEIVTKAERAKIMNASIPTRSSVAEFDLAMLEEFIDNSKLLVNTLGYKVFDSIEEHLKVKHPDERCFYINSTRGAYGKGVSVSDGFAVLKGSKIANPVSASISPSLVNLRNKLISDNVIDADFNFTKDYIFTSPSLAASIANGRKEWKTQKGKSLKDMEDIKED